MNTGRILVVDDEVDIRNLIEEILTDEGYQVTTAGDAAEARRQLVATRPDLVLLDIWMPDTDGITLLSEWSTQGGLPCPVVIMSGHGTVETAVEATRLGAAEFIEKPLSIAKLLRTVEKGLEKPGNVAVLSRAEMASRYGPVGKSQRMSQLRQQIEQIGPQTTSLLLVGESGSGREACARSAHASIPGGERPFVSLHAGTLPAQNVATLLLGMETNAGTETGYLEEAASGTLYISQLQDMCEEGQQLLLSVIDQGSFARLGRARRLPLDVRIISAIEPAAFADPQRAGIRRELIASLSASIIRVPALREHAEDVPELLQHFVNHLVDKHGLPFRRFSVAAQNRLRNYPWPGNQRELGNLVERLLTAEGPEEIRLEEMEQFLEAVVDKEVPLIERDLLSMPLREAREHFERAYLTEQLSLCGGKVGQLATRVGMERTHLYRKLRSLGINFRRSGSDDS